jgi:hypothetical protein
MRSLVIMSRYWETMDEVSTGDLEVLGHLHRYLKIPKIMLLNCSFQISLSAALLEFSGLTLAVTSQRLPTADVLIPLGFLTVADSICQLLSSHNLTQLTQLWVKVKSTLRETTSRPVCPGIRPPSGTSGQFFFRFHETYLHTFAIFQYGAPSLTRGWVCNLLIRLLLALASAVTLGSKSSRTWDHILLFHLRLGSLSVASYDSQSYSGVILTSLHALLVLIT